MKMYSVEIDFGLYLQILADSILTAVTKQNGDGSSMQDGPALCIRCSLLME